MLLVRIFLLIFALGFAPHGSAAVPSHLFIQGDPPVALTDSARLFVKAETQFNPVEIRSDRPFWIPHLEIPFSALEHDRGAGLDRRIVRSLVFERDGQKFVRWVLNPEDTLYGHQLRKSLQEHGIPFREGTHFVGYLTSSRSCVIQDPKTGLIFSIKGSTNQTGGAWRDKKESVRAARGGRLTSDYLHENPHADRDPDIGVVKEPLSFSFGPADHALIVRQYDHFNNADGKMLVPLFAVLHEKFGRELAAKNGSLDPEAFWNERVGKEFGSVLTRFVLDTGVMYNSPHGQNFLVELDANLRPTGKYFVRDFADAMLFEPIVKVQGGEKLIAHYRSLERSSNTVHLEKMFVMYNPFHAQTEIHPSWIRDPAVWADGFQKRVAETIRSRLSLVPGDSAKLRYSPRYDYYWNQEITGLGTSHGFQELLAQLKIKRQARQALLCSSLFKR